MSNIYYVIGIILKSGKHKFISWVHDKDDYELIEDPTKCSDCCRYKTSKQAKVGINILKRGAAPGDYVVFPDRRRIIEELKNDPWFVAEIGNTVRKV